MFFWERWKERKSRDRELESQTRVLREEPPFAKDLPHYTWKDIERLEEERVPWLKKKRRQL